ncbi:MAG: hypothetical protein AUJ71_04565 [Candidatus Omnitrophica bacterium CG1_02_49_16]|nr:MAG: hypothetical protein AUJ71_04565 [Candidatus Omnitrophica bacterium CG1_02_49_16]
MFRSFRKFLAVALFGVFSLSMVSVSFAATSDSENSVTGFFRKLFHYPVKAVKETAGVTANTLQNTGEKVVAKTGSNTAAVLQGDVAKTPQIVGDAAVGTLETAGQTTAETVQVPVKAAEEETK